MDDSKTFGSDRKTALMQCIKCKLQKLRHLCISTNLEIMYVLNAYKIKVSVK